ncbi:Myosin 10A, isoform D, partial [Modicella reniformis]
MDPLQQQDPRQSDLAQLSNPTEDQLTTILANRFHQGHFYTQIASSVLVQLNPFTPGKIDLPESVLQDQVLTYKDGARLVSTNQSTSISIPHAIQMATSAYLHMRRTGQDQAIIT